MKQFIVKKEESGQTLEKYVKKVLNVAPLSFIYKLFRKKDVKVNGHWQDMKYVLSCGENVSIYVTDQQLDEFTKTREVRSSTNISNWVVYEDQNILIINKPRGILVQKDNSQSEALDDMVISYLANKGEYNPSENLGYSPAPAHRLDRNTAGLVIFGKNLETLQALQTSMNDKTKIEKKYLTLVEGEVEESGSIDYPLLKLASGRVENSKDGKEAHTLYKLIKKYEGFSLVEVTLLTGRTHQIRVHFSLIGHPVVGDKKYGNFAVNKEIENRYNFKNQFLMSYFLRFNNMNSKLSYLNGKEFKVKLTNELLDLLNNLIEK